MNLKGFFAFLSPSAEREIPVRIDGSFTGKARLEAGTLTRLEATVQQISSQRPYNYDLDLSAGAFSIIMVEPILPKKAFVPGPAEALAQDLQNMLEVLPPHERNTVESSFRVLWHEGGEVTGLGFRVAPPGRIETQKRIRTEEEYDRLSEKQALEGYSEPVKARLPRWATLLLCLLAVAATTWIVYTTGPEPTLKALEEVSQSIDVGDLQNLIRTGEFEADLERISFNLYPLEELSLEVERLHNGAQETDPSLENETIEARLRRRLALEALIKGSLYLEVIDEEGIIMDRIPFRIIPFEGIEPVRVQTRGVQISSIPKSIRIRP